MIDLKALLNAAKAEEGEKAPEESAPPELMCLLAKFKDTMPQVNPPEALRVLQTSTAIEVSGEPEPEAQALSKPEPATAKPAPVLEAERAPKPKRTAKVVQAELDEALATIKVLERKLAKLDRSGA